MKLIEKLAKDFAHEREEQIRLGTVTFTSKELCAEISARYSINLRDEHILAYEDGFYKAKGMALSAIYSSGGDPTGHIESLVCEIGEEEV